MNQIPVQVDIAMVPVEMANDVTYYDAMTKGMPLWNVFDAQNRASKLVPGMKVAVNDVAKNTVHKKIFMGFVDLRGNMPKMVLADKLVKMPWMEQSPWYQYTETGLRSLPNKMMVPAIGNPSTFYPNPNGESAPKNEVVETNKQVEADVIDETTTPPIPELFDVPSLDYNEMGDIVMSNDDPLSVKSVSRHFEPIKEVEPKYFEVAGVKCKLEGDKLFQKEWTDVEDPSEYRVTEDGEIQRLDWVEKES